MDKFNLWNNLHFPFEIPHFVAINRDFIPSVSEESLSILLLIPDTHLILSYLQYKLSNNGFFIKVRLNLLSNHLT